MKLKYTQEQLLFNTVRITVGDDLSGSIGTGFIVKYPLPYDAGKFYTFLVSAKHVFEPPTQQIKLNFHKLDPTSEAAKPKLGESIRIDAPSFESAFFCHPDPNVDLACIQISGILEMINKQSDQLGEIYFLATEPHQFATYNEEDLLPGLKVFYIGYPAGEFDDVNNLPLLRIGYASSSPKIDYKGVPQFIIDGEVHPGSSGSPVYGIFGQSIALLGVLTAMLADYEAIEGNAGGKTLFARQRLGLGVVIKVSRLKELLDIAYESCEKMLGRNQAQPV